MRTHREMPWLWRSLVSIACALPASACVDAIVGEVEICEYDGKGYTLNEKFKSKDGCNECTCTIEGEVECTTRECGPATGCDEKNGCEDAGGGAYSDAGAASATCEPKYGCTDAGAYADAGTGTSLEFCTVNGTPYKLGETFLAEDGCSSCFCDMRGNVTCKTKICFEPDAAVAPGTCEYAGKVYMPGNLFAASDDCNKCECTESGVVACTVGDCNTDAGIADGGSGSPVDYCQYQGVTYRVGESFSRGDGCNKCSCLSHDLVECSNLSCTAPRGCLLGDRQIPIGESVVCDDGCNTCTCQMDGDFARTQRACSALPAISKCAPSADALHLPAALVYLSGDALAVSESRCVNGQTNDFSLCYEDLVSTMGNLTTVFAVPGSGVRTCMGGERVYSLTPLRDDYLAAFPGRSGGKIVLAGTGDDLFYQFGM